MFLRRQEVFQHGPRVLMVLMVLVVLMVLCLTDRW